MLKLCYRKIFLMKDFSSSIKSQPTIKNRVSQQGMLAPLGGARRGFKTVQSIPGGSKRLKDFYLVFRVLLFSVAQCQFFSAVTLYYVIRKRLSGVKHLATLWLAIIKALKTKCVWFSKKVVTRLTILYLALTRSDTLKKAKRESLQRSPRPPS